MGHPQVRRVCSTRRVTGWCCGLSTEILRFAQDDGSFVQDDSVPQSKDSEVLMGLQMHQGILTTRSIRRNAFVLHRNAIIWGSFDSADSPLRGGSAPDL